MKKFLTLWMVGSFSIAAMIPMGFAEETANKSAIFDGIKAEMESAVAENRKLLEENKTLKSQLVSLQLEMDRLTGEIERLDPGFSMAEEPSYETSAISSGLDKKQDDAVIQEAQDIYLSGQSLDLDAQQRLKELYLYDLQYQKQELELELKSKEIQYRKIEKGRSSERDALQAEIRRNVDQGEELSLRAAELEKKNLVYPQKIELLKMENKALKQKIGQLKKLLSK